MATRKKGDFIDFLVQARKDPGLANKFLKIEDPEKLEKFFLKNNFSVDLKDCKKLVKITKKTTPLEVAVKDGPFMYAELK